MSLERYRRERLVIQTPKTPVYDAARAMESNHIGLVVVAEHGQVVGMLTDRDIALRVVGFQLDPTTTALEEVMTPDPAMLPIGATEQQALELMRDRHVRRIPIVEDGEVVGLVTLDDLILSEDAELAELRGIVSAQLAEPAALKPKGALHPTKPARYASRSAMDRELARAARAQQTTAEALRRVQARTGLEPSSRARLALEIVVSGIVRRLTSREAGDLIAQLPSELGDQWLDLPAGPDRSVTRQTIAQDLAAQLEVGPAEADRLVGAVGLALTDLVSSGELDDVRQQLPKGFRELLS